jgi:hypothetical protein
MPESRDSYWNNTLEKEGRMSSMCSWWLVVDGCIARLAVGPDRGRGSGMSLKGFLSFFFDFSLGNRKQAHNLKGRIGEMTSET